MCTGFLHHYPYLPDDLRYRGANTFAPKGLYKGIVWMREGNGRMMYIGLSDLLYSFNMFDLQAKWAVLYMAGNIKLPGGKQMKVEADEWVQK